MTHSNSVTSSDLIDLTSALDGLSPTPSSEVRSEIERVLTDLSVTLLPSELSAVEFGLAHTIDAISKGERSWGAGDWSLIDMTLKRAPDLSMTEAQLAALWAELAETLGHGLRSVPMPSAGSSSDEKSAVTGVDCPERLRELTAECGLQTWIDRGLEDALDDILQRLDALSVAEGARPRAGLRISGVGASASLMWIYRALTRRSYAVSAARHAGRLDHWETPPSSQDQALIIDDLHQADRLCTLTLARAISDHDGPLLIVWSGPEIGQSKALSRALSAGPSPKNAPMIHLPLEPWSDEEWSEWITQSADTPTDQRVVDRPEVLMRPSLTQTDTLSLARTLLLEGGTQPITTSITPGDLEIHLALLGPVAPLKALARVIDQNVDRLASSLRAIGIIQVGQCPFGGPLMSFSNAHVWGESLSEAGRHAHRLAPDLSSALHELYPIDQRWRVLPILKRLHRLCGLGPLPARPFSPPSQRSLWTLTEPLIKTLNDRSPNRFTLSALCGLGLEWATWGPRWGLWREATRALHAGAAAAERLKDPARAGLLLLSLGGLSLSQGRAEAARDTLEASTHLLRATRRGLEAVKSILLCAEAETLMGRPLATLKRLEGAEVIASELGRVEGVWHARMRRGQLLSLLDRPQEALTVWARLPHLGVSDKMREALLLERAQAHFSCERLDEARTNLDLCEESLTRSALEARWAWSLSTEPIDAIWASLHTVSQRAQSGQEVGAWIMIQGLRAQFATQVSQTPEHIELATKGVERAIQIASGLRDRLRMIHLYDHLGELYTAKNLPESAEAAQEMSAAWIDALDGGLYDLRSQRPRRQESSHEGGDIRLQAVAEVRATLAAWERYAINERPSSNGA